MRILLTIGMAALAVGCGERGPAEPAAPFKPDWAKIATDDIRAAHEMVLASHPGPVDPEAPGFTAQAEKSLASALALAARAETASGYVFATRAYAAGFRDPHVWFEHSEELQALRQDADEVQWPGLFIGWRDGMASVTFAEPDAGAAKGEQLISCDGRSFETMMREDVFPYAQLTADIPSAWTYNAGALLRSSGNPFIARPKACAFKGKDGEHSVDLQWRAPPDGLYQEASSAALYGTPPAPGIEQFVPGVWWVSMPTFDPPDADTAGALRRAIETIGNDRDRLLASRAVVFDVRGNGGGHSSWGADALVALYGLEYSDHRFQRQIRTFWRAEPSNAARLRESAQELAALQHADAGSVLERAKRMDAAIVAGTALMPGGTPGDFSPRSAPLVANPVKAQVFLLTDGLCMSSCLIFADMLLSMEGVRHIGYPTGADTEYTSVRRRPLPSGHGTFIHPMMIRRDPGRKSGTFFAPEITLNAYEWTDQSVKAWFLSDVLK